jgi:type 1 glutamine amidotransferase/sugar phosphate isomerase/epimerase
MNRYSCLLLAAVAASMTLSAQQPGWTIVGFRVTAQAASFNGTFFEAVDKTAAAGVKAIEGDALQTVGSNISGHLDWNLAQPDIAAVQQKMREAGVAMPVYRTQAFPEDEAGMRKLFQFAKALGVESIVSLPVQLDAAEKLANEYGVNVALAGGQLKSEIAALQAHGRRLGICADTGAFMKQSIKPADGLNLIGDRLLVLELQDAAGENGRAVPLGTGTAGLNDLLWQLYRSKVKPNALVIEWPDASDPAPAIKQSAAFLEKTTTAVLADYIDTVSRTTEPRFKISDEDKQKVEAAVPAKALVAPKKPRKMLVIDMQAAYGGHRSLPYANVAIRSMAEKTGAFEPVFNNDFANLRWEKLRQYDALYLNNTVGPIFNSQEVRESILRFVREGGGLGGHHGTGRASLDWPEFAEMLGAYSGPHTVSDEHVTLKVEDPASPLNAGFHSLTFPWIGEFFRYPSPPYSREKLHVLLTIDSSKTDMSRYTCAGCTRPDGDYAVSWIRTYGKGRVFYSDLGHNPTDFESAPVVQHFLAGIQYILGDLDADATPSAKLAARK